jgi:integrase
MATFKSLIQKHHKKADGTWNVKIRVTHNRQIKYLATPIYAKADDITRTFKLKKNITDKTDKIIDIYQNICADLGLRLKSMPIEELISELENGSKPKEGNIDFFSFANEFIVAMEQNGQTGTAQNYKCAIKALKRLVKRDTLYISEINNSLLTDFANMLIKEKEERNKIQAKQGKRITSHRALSQYLGNLRHLHNEAKAKYNDEEFGKIPIPWSPFSKFKIPKEEKTRKRSLPTEKIRAIINIPYLYRKNARKKIPQNCRFNLAKDVFILSFGLLGMNTADLFNCTILNNDRITYFREKTKSRRSDNAKIIIEIQEQIKELFEAYRDQTGKRVFRFYQMYRDENTFNQAVNKGLKEIGSQLDIEDLEFYAARHSWATIALNILKINKYVVHEGLNHVDEEMKVTDIYIEKDFKAINEANSMVLKFIYSDKPDKEALSLFKSPSDSINDIGEEISGNER